MGKHLPGRSRGRHGGRGRRGRRVRVNELVDQASLEDVLLAIQRLPVDLDWGLVAPNVVPLLPRRRALPVAGEPLSVLLPPGIMVGFGIDAGPAVMHVGREALERWAVDLGELTARALTNVRLRTDRLRPRDVVREAVAEVPVRALQTGDGLASALLLLPDQLERFFGPDPQTFVAPMRDLLLSVPVDVDVDWLSLLVDEFASFDPNGLALDAYVLEHGVLRLERLNSAARAWA